MIHARSLIDHEHYKILAVGIFLNNMLKNMSVTSFLW
jgi:hypothetical protein